MKNATAFILSFLLFVSCNREQHESIDRFDLVSRHNVKITTVDSLNSLTVGNGDFAFTADITGLQTFPEYYVKGIPLGTFSNWCWHSFPNDEGYSHDQVVKYFKVGGREVGYYHDYRREGDTERAKASAYLRENPHRMNMGMIGFKILNKDGQRITYHEVQNPDQILDIWKGEIRSYFEIEGVPVMVNTICHPDDGIIACKINSELLSNGQLVIEFRFPEADKGWKNLMLWGNDETHESLILGEDEHALLLKHAQDSTSYVMNILHDTGKIEQTGIHTYILTGNKDVREIAFTCEFEESQEKLDKEISFDNTKERAEDDWNNFWESGGAVDFSNCKDSRAHELERRIVLSQYLTRVNCGGSLPPQETGLTYNSWYGKFHLEMHWWHGVHFALWQRESILEKQMKYYDDIREKAEQLAEFQGYKGVRWPKMVGPDGMTSPSSVGNYLIWQQPHYIYFAELLYDASENKDSLLGVYSDLVFATADFMASYANYDSINDRYVLGPALIPAQETFHAETTINPAFEVTYWYWTMNTAIRWKERMDQQVPLKWQEVADKISDLTVQDSLYLFTEDGTDSYTNKEYLSDHPMILGCLGVLPETDKVDRQIMERTFEKVVNKWNWPRTWGWDYPMVAMAAAALNRPEDAIRFLLLDVQKNTYLPNGHNYQDGRLTLYLPGNGGLLTAVARMCTKDQFPKDGNWDVRWEGLNDF